MEKAIRITGTSFLMPNNRAWEALRSQGALSYGDYGDWPTALLNTSSHEELVWVLFLPDLVTPATLSDSSANSFDALLGPILAPLNARLQRDSPASVVVAFSTHQPDSPIRSGRDHSTWQKLARHLSDTLYALAAAHPGLYLLNCDDLFAEVGYSACFDARNFYLAHCRLSTQGIRVLADGLTRILHRKSTAAKKVLVLDCDNTLWGGVVGEVGVEGLTLGQDGLGSAFVDFQREVLKLIAEGTIVALASKNNEPEVWQVFDEHSSMLLKRSHIAAWKIDWNDKATNLERMAQELDLGLDSFVFWDDNQLERERMRAQLPQVTTPEIPAEVTQWPAYLARMPEFARFSVTQEDRNKTEQYRSRSAFVSEKQSAIDEVEFLRSIELRPEAVEIGPATLSRAAQLCAKTNQFNLRTRRYTDAQIAELARNNGGFVVRLADRFGDHGIVGLVLLRECESRSFLFLDTFLVSCRALGRHLEAWMLDRAVQTARARGATWLIAERIPTDRNVIAQDFLSQHGMQPLSSLSPLPDGMQSEVQNLSASGELFAAPLNEIKIPYMEVFADGAIAAYETA